MKSYQKAKLQIHKNEIIPHISLLNSIPRIQNIEF